MAITTQDLGTKELANLQVGNVPGFSSGALSNYGVPQKPTPDTTPTSGSGPGSTEYLYANQAGTQASRIASGGQADPSPTFDYYSRSQTPSPTPSTDYVDPNAPKPVVAETEEQAQIRKAKEAQASIDNLNKYYDTLLQEQQQTNEARERRTNALSVMSGLSGSTEAVGSANVTTALNQRDLGKINAERAVAIDSVLSNIRSSAVEAAKQSRIEARQSAEDILAYKTKKKEDAKSAIQALSKTGSATLEGLKATLQPTEYQHLMESLGDGNATLGEAQAKAIIFDSRDKKSIIGTPTLTPDGRFMQQSFQDMNGNVKTEFVPVPVGITDPKNIIVEKTDAGIFMISKVPNADGSFTSFKITGSEKPTEITPTGDNPQLYKGLSTPTATAVRSQVTKYDAHPIVQSFATVQEGKKFADSLSNTTTNPADDQGLIYALAKALDPGSVVREGEYATAQKYSQSWINAFGKGITQALVGTGFLSQSARENIKKTIASKYQASKDSYDNIYNEYTTSINNLTGRNDGTKFLKDYRLSNSSSPQTITAPDGQEIEIID